MRAGGKAPGEKKPSHLGKEVVRACWEAGCSYRAIRRSSDAFEGVVPSLGQGLVPVVTPGHPSNPPVILDRTVPVGPVAASVIVDVGYEFAAVSCGT